MIICIYIHMCIHIYIYMDNRYTCQTQDKKFGGAIPAPFWDI